MNNPQAILACSQLTRSFTEGGFDVSVLKAVNLTVEVGQQVAIVGQSGSGKSTLLHLLGGLDKPTAGQVQLAGHDFSAMNESRRSHLRNRHLGFVYQFHHLLQEFTALENVCIPAYIKKTPKGEVEKKAKELLEFLGLSHRIHHKPNELSGGEQQRVAVARSLINNPSIIFADEPSGNLDSESADNLHKLFFELNDFWFSGRS